MKVKTYNNVMKAIKIIQKKGYNFEEAKDIVLLKFENYDKKCGLPIEYFLNKVLSKEEFNKQTYNITREA